MHGHVPEHPQGPEDYRCHERIEPGQESRKGESRPAGFLIEASCVDECKEEDDKDGPGEFNEA